MAHEYRTPLTLIKGNAAEIGDEHEGEIAERAMSIVHNSDKILFLVNQMLNLSKIEEDRVPKHYTQRDLVAFIRFVAGNLHGVGLMRVYDLAGRTVGSESLTSGRNSIDLSDLPKGTYIVALENQGCVKTQKIIIQ